MSHWVVVYLKGLIISVKKYTGTWGELAPEMPKRAQQICIEFNANKLKSVIFRQAWKVAPKIVKYFFPPVSDITWLTKYMAWRYPEGHSYIVHFMVIAQ